MASLPSRGACVKNKFNRMLIANSCSQDSRGLQEQELAPSLGSLISHKQKKLAEVVIRTRWALLSEKAKKYALALQFVILCCPSVILCCPSALVYHTSIEVWFKTNYSFAIVDRLHVTGWT